MPDLPPDLARTVGNALARAVHDDDGALVTRWLSIIETIDGDGDTSLSVLVPDGMKAWDAEGMLAHARQMLREDDDA